MIHLGDCLEIMPTLDAESMGRQFDALTFGAATCFR